MRHPESYHSMRLLCLMLGKSLRPNTTGITAFLIGSYAHLPTIVDYRYTITAIPCGRRLGGGACLTSGPSDKAGWLGVLHLWVVFIHVASCVVLRVCLQMMLIL